MDFADAYLMTKLGHPELAGWWGKLLGGGGGPIDDGGSKLLDQMTWSQIVASTKTGKYKTFEIGQVAPMDLGDLGTVYMQISGIDKDIRADGSGNAALSFIIKDFYGSGSTGAVASGANTYWPESTYYNHLHNVVWPRLPEIVRDNIVPVIKYTNTFVGDDADRTVDFESIETIWAPSSHELMHSQLSSAETKGVTYSELFPDNNSRIKHSPIDGTAKNYFTRTAFRKNLFRGIRSNGTDVSPSSSSTAYWTVFGFCL